MRGLRDGRPVDFDQADPPADGGRPSTEALIVADDEQVLYPLDDARVLRLCIPAR